ncbi:hypothetical protein FRC10_000889 [Ceratobasidium sp. 414]|nr:hypothetical protein FRC10_000889 [Ceratobasidium sp. 414]
MATALTVPLDHWVAANSHPIKIESPDDLRALGARRDYSTIGVEEAFALLHHTCKACFGDLAALEFSVKESDGPLAYSATLTVTGPDEIGIEFPDSGKHPTAIMAKMHAAHRAVQQGVIAFMMQGQNLASNTPRTVPDRFEPSGLPPRGAVTHLTPLNPPTVPKKPQTLPKTLLVPMASTSSVPLGTSSKPLATSSKLPAASFDKSPVSVINELLQKVYSAKKLHKLANTGLKWEQKLYHEGYLARMTVTLPSGISKSYGSVPETLPANHHKSKYPLKVEAMPNVAKRAVATYAIKLGVLGFIATEDVSGRALASVVLPPKPTFLPPKPPVATGSNQIELKVPSVQQEINALPFGINNDRLRTSFSPVNDTPIVDERTIDDAPPTDDMQTPGDAQAVNDVQAMDEILGSPQISRPPSPKVGNETFKADVESRHTVRERLGSYEPLDPDDQSESMELDTEVGAVTREHSVMSDTARKVSLEMEEDRSGEEPPKKRQKTEPPENAVSEKTPGPVEVKVIQGASYADILSAYCVENGHLQPQVTYQRQRNESDPNAPVLYHVSIVVGLKRYELSKHYESVQSAEEKLSKRILKLFGIRAKKA